MVSHLSQPPNPLSWALWLFPLLLISIVLGTQSTSGETISVDGEGGADFTTIQEAINSSAHGDVIRIHGGVYQGNLTVHRGIMLEGVGEEPIIIDGYGSRYGMQILADDVTVRNISVRNTERGIRITADSITILENEFLQNNTYGLEINGSHGLKIEDNEFRDCRGFAIRIIVGSDILVRNNVFIENGYGVSCDVVSDSRIENNYFRNHSVGVYVLSSENIVIEENSFIDNRAGVFIIADTSHNIRLKDNEYSGNRRNIRTWGDDEKDPMENPFVVGSIVVITMMALITAGIFLQGWFQPRRDVTSGMTPTSQPPFPSSTLPPSEGTSSSEVINVPLKDPVKHELDGESGNEKTHDPGHDLGTLLPHGLGNIRGNEEEKPGDQDNKDDGNNH
jgi:parallel beta-helix repeat protein